MRWWSRSRLISISALSACAFTASTTTEQPDPDAAIVDAELADAFIPDAGMCMQLGTECVGGEVLRQCHTMGQPPQDTTCGWSCVETGGGPHCGVFTPSGALLPSDLADDPMLQSKDLNQLFGLLMNTDTGAITGFRGPGEGVSNGIGFTIRDGVGIWRFAKVKVSGQVELTGTNAAAIASLGDLHFDGFIDVTGGCRGGDAGPGGSPGASAQAAAEGPGGGDGGANTGGGEGAGGGAHGGAGGSGAANGPDDPDGGVPFGSSDEITVLRGGGGGGGGGGTIGAIGGGGGGALQLASNTKIKITSPLALGGINAGGCGGGNSTDGAGGGGAGGMLLFEAPAIEIQNASLAVNGGGGGGSSAQGSQPGDDGAFGTTPADGGGTGGGAGGAGSTVNGQPASGTGGGGGGAGRIRINTLEGKLLLNNISISPRLNQMPPTTAKSGLANVQ